LKLFEGALRKNNNAFTISQELKVNENDFIDFAEFMKLRSLGGFMSGLLIIPQGKPYE
jgi:hypothetical protein